MKLTFGSLFAGIGGFDLGFERAGMECKWQVEIDPYCQKVLAKHWPNVTRHDDVRTFPPRSARWTYEPKRFLPTGPFRPNTRTDTTRAEWFVDVICGGFPCQDISNAGKRAGIEGERSGLWSEFHRIICTLRPRFVVVENVAALLNRGIDRVLADLAASGYDAEWQCIPAAAVGAPHIRDRVWIVAYAERIEDFQRHDSDEKRRRESEAEQVGLGSGSEYVADAGCEQLEVRQSGRRNGRGLAVEQHNGDAIPNAAGGRCPMFWRSSRDGRHALRNDLQACGQGHGHTWTTEPNVGRVAHGIPNRVDRLTAIGNSIVPQVAEWIGRRILESLTD